ncbi:MAG: YciK family oxidoreductase [Gammaproteobacteria bacterium]|nr:YciK family oxidoreductase [Gammaproteobacteria bacterium]MDJ0890883.1 YciK family oxidoreductase [Gammaproteobacteria bacterium]
MKKYRPVPDLLSDRVILVSGAGDGIGKTAAKSFAAHGATVILLGRTVPKLEAVYDEIEGSGHPQPAIYPINLEGAAPKDYQDLADTLEREFGRLDGLLHNATNLGSLTPLEHYDLQLWAQVMQVNLHAPFLLTRSCLPVLRKSPDASVVFTSSALGRAGRAYWGAYAISNFAVEGMMQVLAEELESKPQIRVNSLDPGWVRTTFFSRAYPARDPGTLPAPEEIMPAYLYLMGPDSRGITGRAMTAQEVG